MAWRIGAGRGRDRLGPVERIAALEQARGPPEGNLPRYCEFLGRRTLFMREDGRHVERE